MIEKGKVGKKRTRRIGIKLSRKAWNLMFDGRLHKNRRTYGMSWYGLRNDVKTITKLSCH